jgi:hypothetical protein
MGLLLIVAACAAPNATAFTPAEIARNQAFYERYQALGRARVAGDAAAAAVIQRDIARLESAGAQDAAADDICRQRAGVQATMVRGGLLYQIAAERQFAESCLATYRRTGVTPSF